MHILLTGASGRVGSYTLLHLLSHSHSVLATDLTPLPTHLPLPLPSPSTFHRLDLTDHRALSALLAASDPPIDAVVHLGAIPHPHGRDPREVYANNTVSNYNVLRTALDLGIRRVVQASSVNAAGLIFNQPARQKHDKLPLNEESPMRPEDPYSLSKQVIEYQAGALARLFPASRIASLRLHMVRESYLDSYYEHDASHGSLWSWVSLHATARAFLLGLTSEGWEGHEVFYIVAPEICWEGGVEPESQFKKGERERRLEERDGSEYERVGTRELIEKSHPGTEVDEGWWKGNERRACFDCSKAERLLGWRHEDA